MKKNSLQNVRVIPAACCLIIALLFVAAPAMATGTTNITVTKYHDNNYSAVEDSETLDLAALQGLSSVYSNGSLYMQGLINETDWVNAGQDPTLYDLWDPNRTGVNLECFGEQTGTYVRDITDRVDGMNPGDEIKVAASDGYGMYFNYTNVYAPHPSQGEMILSWENDTSTVPTYENGIRLFFYTPDDLNFTNQDMRESMAPWYWRLTKDWYNSSNICPSAKGLSAKTVSDLEIYPPHRYDFATGGDTTEWAYEGSVGASPGLNDPSETTVDTSKIAADDDLSEQTVSVSNGEYAAQRFVFDVVENPANIESLAVTWIGTGTHESGVDNGATVYIWNDNSSEYEPLNTTTSGSEVTLTGTITTDIADYVIDGNATVLVKQKGASDGVDESTLATNYVKLVVTHHHRNSNFVLP